MNRKMVTKILAAMLAFILSFANVALLGIYGGNTYAASSKLEEQKTAVNKAKVEFDAYFEEGEKTAHSKILDVEKEDILFISIKVEEGYLTNASINIENANFKIQETEGEFNSIQEISYEENKIILNQINKEETAILEIPIKISEKSSLTADELCKIASITLEGKYINNKGKEIEVNKTIEVETTIDGTADSILTEEVSKYVTFNVGESKGVILQTVIKSKIEDNKLPIKSTKLEIEIPIINNISPKAITLSAKSQNATNGQTGKVFSEEEYTYENGKVILTLENDRETLSWLKDAEDEIILTCIYEESAIVEEAQIKLNAKSEITYYGAELKTVNKEISQSIELKEQIGDVVTLDLGVSENKIYKGYMLKENGKNTAFVSTLELNIGYSELIDKIIFKDETSYIDESGNSFTSNALYTYTKVSRDNLVEILGEDGYINIYNSTGEIIATLNKDNLEYKYEENAKGIIFETSKPQVEGILNIENGREIESLEYSKAQEEKFNTYRVNLITNILKDNTIIIKGSKFVDIALENTSTQAELSISKQNISTVVVNEGVELRVTLKTTEASSQLYKNPKIEIVLPSYITNVKTENVKLLYEKELKIADARMYRNENGNIVIAISLSGEQTEYNEVAITEGATLIMNADIYVNALTPTKSENVYLNVTNENSKDVVSFEAEMKFIAPSGMVTVNQISGYNDKNETATSISGKKEVGEIDVQVEAKIAKVNMTVINNYDYACENIIILGRTPFEGNKSIKTGADLGSTFTAKVVSGISAVTGVSNENITVYYSKNGEATKDLGNSQNGWTVDTSNLSEIKSYMIVINGASLKTGETLGFAYNIEIPAGLEHNEETYGIFTVYYTKQDMSSVTTGLVNKELDSVKIASSSLSQISANITKMLAENTETSYIEESTESGMAGVTTGEGPNLKVELSAKTSLGALENNAQVEEKEKITYTAKITNQANMPAKNVTVRVEIPERAFYVDGDTVDIESTAITFQIPEIPASGTQNVTFVLQAKMHLGSSGSTYYSSANKLNTKVTVTVEGYETVFNSNEIVNEIIAQSSEPRIIMSIIASSANPTSKGAEVKYSVIAVNNISGDLTNVRITCVVPEEIRITDITNGGIYNENDRTITWEFDKFSSESIQWCGRVDSLGSGVYDKDLNIVFTATCNESNKTFASDTYVQSVYTQGLSISQTSDISNSYLSSGDTITYIINVKNLSKHQSFFAVVDTLPSELEFIRYYCTQNGNLRTVSASDTNKPSIGLNLEGEEAVTIYIEAKAKTIEGTKTITNEVSAVFSNMQIKATPLTHTLTGVQGGNNQEEQENPESTPTYRISGTAWLDENRNGKRDDGERLLSGIKVFLLQNKTNKLVATVVTNENGAYTFQNLEKGDYIVAFEYDRVSYDLSIYQADNVHESFNSDVVEMEATIDGVTKTYGATTTINLTSNMYNIDIGLVTNPKFDLSLEKTISLVQVSNQKGVSSYRFDNVNLAQVQIDGASMAGSVVAITYTFKIKNEGAVVGYVNKVVDYKAKDLNFNSTLNPEWYQDTNGDIFTNLEGQKIEPGETIELSLILTKTMTDENTGLSNNLAEIAEASNDLGLEDIDSVPGNKNTEEDDMGSADVIIAVKTGGILFYGGIVLIVLAVFALGAYEINKKVLKKI